MDKKEKNNTKMTRVVNKKEELFKQVPYPERWFKGNFVYVNEDESLYALIDDDFSKSESWLKFREAEAEDDEFFINDMVVHLRTGVIETIVDFCKIKINGEWVDGVIYEGKDRYTGELKKFVREIKEFKKEFRKYYR